MDENDIAPGELFSPAHLLLLRPVVPRRSVSLTGWDGGTPRYGRVTEYWVPDSRLNRRQRLCRWPEQAGFRDDGRGFGERDLGSRREVIGIHFLMKRSF